MPNNKMGWDNTLMAFVDLLLQKNMLSHYEDFYVTRKDIVDVTGLSETAVSNNLRVCVRDGWLRRVEFNNGFGREVRYYVNNRELVSFVNKFLR